MRRDDERLADIRHAAEAAERFILGRTRDDLEGDPILASALVYQITIIGEAAKNVSPQTQARLPDVKWTQMIGMRNVVVHAYWHLDLDELWRTVQDDLPDLLETLPEITDEGAS